MTIKTGKRAMKADGARRYGVYDLFSRKYLGQVWARNFIEACVAGEKRFGVPCTAK